ncbi:MAG: hypothetical protein J7L96_04340 [Bacteroidales bacterium]|nr:hypothetical protein [Bacteroidales bacterium]
MKKTVGAFIIVLSMFLLACSKEQPKIWSNPEATLDEVGHCKEFSPKTRSDYPNNTDCILFAYDGDSMLTMTHINAGFNCCPEEFLVNVDLQNDTIFIRESERNGLCDCNCLYDLHFTIEPIPPGNYFISVDEPYARQAGEPRLQGLVDLSEAGSGEICVERSFYPWGL